MPELPEVETTRRGIAPHLLGRRVLAATLRRPDLRWPIATAIRDDLPGQRIHAVARRAKYLLIEAETGSAILHLGMSGCLRVLPAATPASTHDHVDLLIEGGLILRLNDPRRFGALLWQPHGETHPLLANLGPEPLVDEFDGALLYRLSRGRRAAVKTFLMDQATVVGVGNIYAAESLFEAGIDPRRAAGRVSLARYQRLRDRPDGNVDRATRNSVVSTLSTLTSVRRVGLDFWPQRHEAAFQRGRRAAVGQGHHRRKRSARLAAAAIGIQKILPALTRCQTGVGVQLAVKGC